MLREFCGVFGRGGLVGKRMDFCEICGIGGGMRDGREKG